MKASFKKAQILPRLTPEMTARPGAAAPVRMARSGGCRSAMPPVALCQSVLRNQQRLVESLVLVGMGCGAVLSQKT